MDRRDILITAGITVAITIGLMVLSIVTGGYASTGGVPGLAQSSHELDGPILLHLATAAGAAIVGPFILLRQKGDRLHKTLGRIWAALMMITAICSAFIRTPGAGIAGTGFSFIHFFTIWTLINIPIGVWAARTGRVGMHRGIMAGLYIGLLVAGAFTFIPGRMLGNLVFG